MSRRSIYLFLIISSFFLINSARAEKISDMGAEKFSLTLSLPQNTSSGSFVVRIEARPQPYGTETQLELWRSYENEEPVLVSRQPVFNAISQMLYQPGKYGYQVKLVRLNEGEVERLASSEIKHIQIENRAFLSVTR